MGYDFCRNKSYNNIMCESDCLKVVELFVVGSDHTLHTHATNILHIKEFLHGNDNTTLVCMFLENKIYVRKFYS